MLYEKDQANRLNYSKVFIINMCAIAHAILILMETLGLRNESNLHIGMHVLLYMLGYSFYVYALNYRSLNL